MSTFILILKIISYVLTAGIPLFFSIKSSRKKITALQDELSEEQEKLKQEILRSQEKQRQVEDLLKFQANDNRIKNDMEKSVDILKEAKSNAGIKKEFIKISSRVWNIYNND